MFCEMQLLLNTVNNFFSKIATFSKIMNNVLIWEQFCNPRTKFVKVKKIMKPWTFFETWINFEPHIFQIVNIFRIMSKFWNRKKNLNCDFFWNMNKFQIREQNYKTANIFINCEQILKRRTFFELWTNFETWTHFKIVKKL